MIRVPKESIQRTSPHQMTLFGPISSTFRPTMTRIEQSRLLSLFMGGQKPRKVRSSFRNSAMKRGIRMLLRFIPRGLMYVSRTRPKRSLSMYTQNQWQGDPDSSGVDDVAFTMEMLDNFEKRYCIDSSRVYAAGKSNGGGFTNLLACDPTAFKSIDYCGICPRFGCLLPGRTRGRLQSRKGADQL